MLSSKNVFTVVKIVLEAFLVIQNRILFYCIDISYLIDTRYCLEVIWHNIVDFSQVANANLSRLTPIWLIYSQHLSLFPFVYLHTI